MTSGPGNTDTSSTRRRALISRSDHDQRVHAYRCGFEIASVRLSFPRWVCAATLHVLDRALLDIANECRFLIDEVREYYDRYGDIERTRNRFKKMRDVLSTLADDPDDIIVPNFTS